MVLFAPSKKKYRTYYVLDAHDCHHDALRTTFQEAGGQARWPNRRPNVIQYIQSCLERTRFGPISQILEELHSLGKRARDQYIFPDINSVVLTSDENMAFI